MLCQSIHSIHCWLVCLGFLAAVRWANSGRICMYVCIYLFIDRAIYGTLKNILAQLLVCFQSFTEENCLCCSIFPLVLIAYYSVWQFVFYELCDITRHDIKQAATGSTRSLGLTEKMRFVPFANNWVLISSTPSVRWEKEINSRLQAKGLKLTAWRLKRCYVC